MMFAGPLLWLALIWLAVWAASRLFPSVDQRQSPDRGLTPIEIVARRYARGEISRIEFEQIKDDLLGESPQDQP